MGRPRRPYNGVETIAESRDDPWLKSLITGGLGRRREIRYNKYSHANYRTPNGINDPLTYLHVLAVLMNIDPDIELRANKLSDFLMTWRKQFSWDAVTVGKVLANLAESFEDVLSEKNGLLEAGRDYKGAFYRIHHNSETAALAVKLSDDLIKLVETEMAYRDVGRKTPRLDSPLLECPSVRVEWSLPADEEAVTA